MKDEEASRTLIKHIYRRVEEFLDTYDAAEFADADALQQGFVRFLRNRDVPAHLPKDTGAA